MILTNQIGYDSNDFKKAVFQGKKEDKAGNFQVLNKSGDVVYTGVAKECGEVANWKTGYYWTMDFSDVTEPGDYIINLETAGGNVKSFPFSIHPYLNTMRMINAASYYFKAQRCSGECLEENSHVKFANGKEGIADVHGGWYDATGDYSIHMSHLSHGAVNNPQQSSFSGYAFFIASDLLGKSENVEYSMIRRRMLDEGYHGADFVMRMRAPSGSFYRSVRRSEALDHVRGTHFINFEYRHSSDQFSAAATADKEVINDENYEVSLRSGGGLCIATLAAASRHYYPGTGFSQEEYILAAKDAWEYLSKNNEKYTNDGQWNLIDEYCALLALVELYKACEEYEYLESAEKMAKRIMSRMEERGENMACLTVQPGRPFYHPSDEGMPVFALLEFAKIEPKKSTAHEAVIAAEKIMRYQLHISHNTVNPFCYPRYEYKDFIEKAEYRFFFPHDTAVAPWWQGENARLASLSAAARMLSEMSEDRDFALTLREFSCDQLNWIMGLNPFDSCMMEGYGRNNIQYFFGGRYDFINCPGGICNGITAATNDVEGIEFCTEFSEEVKDNWRWAEQWIPHNSWFIIAQAMKKI